MAIGNEDLKRLYDVCNAALFDGKLPDIPVCFEDLGGEFNAHMCARYDPFRPVERRWDVWVGVADDLPDRLLGSGGGCYTAFLVEVMLHEMCHVKFVADGIGGQDGGGRFTGEPHSAKFYAVAEEHGLRCFFDTDTDYDFELVAPEAAELLAEHGITVDMEGQRDMERYVSEGLGYGGIVPMLEWQHQLSQ